MGIRKTIYIKSEEEWLQIEESAKRIDRSVSWYLMSLHRGMMDANPERFKSLGPPSEAERAQKKGKPLGVNSDDRRETSDDWRGKKLAIPKKGKK